MSDNIQATLTIQTKIAEDAKLSKFIQDFPGQWAAIDRAAKAAGVTIDQVQQSLATLGTKKNFLQMAAEGATFTRGEWTQLNSVIKKLAYDQLKIQADAALAAQKATKETKAQTDATKQLAQQTTNLGNAQKQTTAAKKGKTGQGLLVEQEKGVNTVQRQLGQLDIDKQKIDAKKSDREQAALDAAFLIRQRELAEQRNRLMASTEEKIRAERRKTADEAKAQRQKEGAELRREMSERGRDATKLNAIMSRALKAEVELRKQIIAAIEGQGAAGDRVSKRLIQGQSVTQSFFNQLMEKGINQQNANYLVGGGKMPAGFGGAGGGGWQKILGMLGFGGGGGAAGSLIRGALGATGIGAGFYGVGMAATAAVDSAKAATAYDRMEVSARKLAGSQAELNALLEAYQEAAGGAVSQATALENVTRLQATGFAKNADEVERFVRGARGAALSLGKPQEFITQETQLAVSNTSVKRLDQIGLGIQEVDKRTKELRQTNKGWTREMAFQEAVIGLLNEKYGALSDTMEGQATGLEKLNKTWDDLFLMIGQGLQRPINDMANWIDTGIKKVLEWIEVYERLGDVVRDVGRAAIGLDPLPNEIDISPPNESAQAMRRQRQEVENPFAEERQAMAEQRAERLVEIEENKNEQLSEANRSYIEGLVNTNNSYYRTLARDNEDYQRSRAKSEANYARQVAEVHEDAADREVEAAKDLMNQIVRMNRDAAREEARAQRDYNRSIERMNEEHAESMQDLEKDYRKRVEDIEEEHGRNIAEAREDSMERLQEMQTEYDDKITEARADSSKQLVEMEADYAKDRKRAFEQYQLSNLEAASNMDAKSLWMNQKRFELETKQAQEAHQEAIDKEGKRLSEFEQEAEQDHQKAISKEQKRLAEFEEEANEAHQRRLDQEKESYEERREQEEEALEKRKKQEAESFELRRSDAAEALKLQQDDLIQAHADQKRENDAADTKRLKDMKAAHLLEQGEAEADRLFRLGRMEVDHQAQLAEMGTQHANRITQIGVHAQEERDKLDEEQITALHDLGIYIEGWTVLLDKQSLAAAKAFDEWFLHVEEKLATEQRGGLTQSQFDRIADLEAQKAPWQAILDDPNSSQADKNLAQQQINRINKEQGVIRNEEKPEVFGSNVQTSGKPIINTGTTGGIVGGGTSVVIHPGAVQITAHPGMSISGLGDEFESRLLTVVKRLAGSNNL